jgi:hypothetical protein
MLAFHTAHVVFLLAARPEQVKRVVAAATESERDGSPLKSFLPLIPIDSVYREQADPCDNRGKTKRCRK